MKCHALLFGESFRSTPPKPVLVAYALGHNIGDIELLYVPDWIIRGSNGTTIDSFGGREIYSEREGLFDGVPIKATNVIIIIIEA